MTVPLSAKKETAISYPALELMLIIIDFIGHGIQFGKSSGIRSDYLHVSDQIFPSGLNSMLKLVSFIQIATHTGASLCENYYTWVCNIKTTNALIALILKFLIICQWLFMHHYDVDLNRFLLPTKRLVGPTLCHACILALIITTFMPFFVHWSLLVLFTTSWIN